jgi:ferredoxin
LSGGRETAVLYDQTKESELVKIVRCLREELIHILNERIPLMNFPQQSNWRISAWKGKNMPNRLDKNISNVPGAYYVDGSCIDCDMCREIAPDVFRRDEEVGLSYVFHQPVTESEKVLAEEARTSCPTESIGNDGTALRAEASELVRPLNAYVQ